MSKTILITGASSGIGKATAIHFQKEGWNVITTMRTPEKETELNNLENVQLEKLDVLDLTSIEQAIKNGISRFGKIDALLNNAGYGSYKIKMGNIRHFAIFIFRIASPGSAVFPVLQQFPVL